MAVITPQEISSRNYTKWYKTVIPVGYFQWIDKVEIHSPYQILFDIGGNIGTTLFFSLFTLGIGMILFLLLSIKEYDKYTESNYATT